MGYADNSDLHFQTSLSSLVPTTAFTRCIQLLKIHTSKFILSWYFSQTQLPCLFTSLTTKRLYLLVPDEDGLEKHVIGFTLRPRIHRIENFKILVDELKKNIFVGTFAMQSILVANKFINFKYRNSEEKENFIDPFFSTMLPNFTKFEIDTDFSNSKQNFHF